MKHKFSSVTEFVRSSRKTILLIIIVTITTIILHTLISILLYRVNHQYISTLGNLRTYGVEAYGGNITLVEGKQIIDWGTIYPGSSINRSFNIQSKSNVEATLLIETANWTFLDSNENNVTGSFTSNMTLTCNKNGSTISPDEKIPVTLTLSAESSPEFINAIIQNDLQKFSFDIILYASEE